MININSIIHTVSQSVSQLVSYGLFIFELHVIVEGVKPLYFCWIAVSNGASSSDDHDIRYKLLHLCDYGIRGSNITDLQK